GQGLPALERRDRRGAGLVQSAARDDCGGDAVTVIPAGARREAGSSEIATSVTTETPAITRSSVAKPAVLTTGPSNHTAAELTPKDTVSRMPLTRERIRSST